METLHNKRRQVSPLWVKITILIFLFLGIYFRFVNLDGKVYWVDEVYTSLWLSGHSSSEIVEKIYNGRVVGIDQLKKYQQPDIEKGVSSTIKQLALEDPQHPPLYYSIAWYWSLWFGNSVAAIRSLSAVISVFSLVSIYYLCRELFELPLTRLMAVSLMAISPFHLLYAQEARQYSLWTLTILISSYALLRALRTKTFFSWVIYSITLTLSFYTFILSIVMAIGHGIHVFGTERLRVNRSVTAYLLSLIAALITFIPWLIILTQGKSEGKIQRLDWIEKSTSLTSLMGKWIFNITWIFIDWININEHTPIKSFFWLIPFVITLLVLIGYSIYYLVHSTPKSSWLFVLSLIFTTVIVLIIPDIIFGGRRSGVSRYLIPTFLGIQLMIAYLLSSKLVYRQGRIGQKIWTWITILLLSGSVVSCVIISNSEIWRNKALAVHQVARLINQTPYPVVVSDVEFPSILGLMHLLNSQTYFQMTNQPTKLVIADNRNNMFLFDPSELLQKYLQTNYTVEACYMGKTPIPKLWKLGNKNSSHEICGEIN